MSGLRRTSFSSPESCWALEQKAAPSSLRDEAVARYKERQYFQAIQLGERALEAASPSGREEILGLLARFHSALGVELFNSGEYRAAEDAFRKALTRAEDSYARFGLGFLSFHRLDDDKARAELDAALLIEPGMPKALKLQGVLEYRAGNVTLALERIREAARLDPGDREAAVLLERWGRDHEALARFREAKRRSFHLRVDPALSPTVAEAALAELDRARQALAKLGMAPVRTVPIVLYSETKFHESTGSLHWIAGLYDGQIKIPVPPSSKASDRWEELREALRHELAHAAVREIGPGCPNWLNEGIAQHFEGPQDAKALRTELRRSTVRRVPLRSVPSRLWEVEDEALARWTYLAGLSFVEHLVAHHEEFRLRLLLRALAREGSLARAFEVTYGTTLEALETAWWDEVMR